VLEMAQATDPAPSAVVVDLEMTNDLDAPSAHELAELHTDLAAIGARLMLARVHDPVRTILDRAGTTTKVGAENIHTRILGAVATHLQQAGSATGDVLMLSADNLRRLLDVVDAQLTVATGADRTQLEALRQHLQETLAVADSV
jgi:hypothetical protein